MHKYIFTLILLVSFMVSCDTTKKNTATNDKPDSAMMDQQAIIGTSWKLSSLKGNAVTTAPNQDTIKFVLHESGEITGFSGCNTFYGIYTLEKGNQIRFAPMLTTLMSCGDLDVKERFFLQVFKLADNYTISGNTLMLNVGKRAPLAVFEAIDI